MKDQAICEITVFLELYLKLTDEPGKVDPGEWAEFRQLEKCGYSKRARDYVYAKTLLKEELSEAEDFFWENERYSLPSASLAAYN